MMRATHRSTSRTFGRGQAAVVLILVLACPVADRALATVEEIYGPFLRFRPPEPAYPPDWRVRGFEGRVEVEALIDTSGNVVGASPVPGGTADTDSAAVANARLWKFHPYREANRRPQARAVRIAVPFAHPLSSNVVPETARVSTASGSVMGSTGQRVHVEASLACVAQLDSVTGLFHYRYSLANNRRSRANVLYVGLYPLENSVVLGISQVGDTALASKGWAGFAGCSDHIDVAGWMSRASSADPRAHGLSPGETISGMSFVSASGPDRGHWIAGGGRGCGPACFPWADTCALTAPLAGLTAVPRGGGARGSISGEVVAAERLSPVADARVTVLGARRDTTTAINGFFFMSDLPVGRFRVRATAPGFGPEESWVEVFPGHAYVRELKMRPALPK